jgi:hypothetical protein
MARCFAGQVDPPTAINSAGTLGSDPVVTAVPTLSHGDLYALVVGISKHKDPAIPQLKTAAKDAVDFAGFLESQKDLFNNIKVELLTDEKATKTELEKYLMYKIRKAGKNDTTVLFFSGHGSVDPKRAGQFFFVTHDSDPEFLEATSVNMTGLGFLRDVDCPRIVLIADACHSGGFSEWKTKSVVSPLKTFFRDFAASAGKVVISSSRPDEYSLESPHRENGVFTHWFLEGLKGAADRDNDGVVTVNEAYNYAYQQTKLETDGAQHPQFQGTVEGILPLSVTAGFQKRTPTVLELTTEPPGAEVLVGGRLVGKTNQDGVLCLKYLPVGRPIPILARKDGWVKQEAPPVEFSESITQVIAPCITLKPALASLEVKTLPGDVAVKVDGQPAGKTNPGGKLTVDKLQVCVDHVLELEKQGFANESFRLSVPADYEGKRFELDQVRLSKISTERPVDRIQKDYVPDMKGKGSMRLRDKPIEGVTAIQKKMLEINPTMDKWDLEMYKQNRHQSFTRPDSAQRAYELWRSLREQQQQQ